jgi:hypothetical protein
MPRHLTRIGDATTTRGWCRQSVALLMMMIMVASCSDAPAPPETVAN